MKALSQVRATTMFATLMLACWPVASADAQGLGDAAKQERTRRIRPVGSPPPKVYTTDDLASAPKGSESAAASFGAQPTPKRAAVSPGSAPASEQEEAHWRERITQAQTAFDAAKLRRTAAQAAWTEDRMKDHGGERPVMMDEPGCSGGQMNFGNGLGGPCQKIAVYNPALFAEFVAARSAEEAAADELAAAWRGAHAATVLAPPPR